MSWLAHGMVIYEDSTWALGGYCYICEGNEKNLRVTDDYAFLPILKCKLYSKNDSVFQLVDSDPNNQIFTVWDKDRTKHNVECRGLFLKKRYTDLGEVGSKYETLDLLYTENNSDKALGVVSLSMLRRFFKNCEDLFNNNSVISLDKWLKSINIVKEDDRWIIEYGQNTGTLILHPFKMVLHRKEYPYRKIISLDSSSMVPTNYEYDLRKSDDPGYYFRMNK